MQVVYSFLIGVLTSKRLPYNYLITSQTPCANEVPTTRPNLLKHPTTIIQTPTDTSENTFSGQQSEPPTAPRYKLIYRFIRHDVIY